MRRGISSAEESWRELHFNLGSSASREAIVAMPDWVSVKLERQNGKSIIPNRNHHVDLRHVIEVEPWSSINMKINPVLWRIFSCLPFLNSVHLLTDLSS